MNLSSDFSGWVAFVSGASQGMGLVGQSDLASYNVSKLGVVGLMKSAALRYAAKNIHINCVRPSAIDMPMAGCMKETQPEAIEALFRRQVIGRSGRPDEVATVVLRLSSKGAGFVHGVALPVHGGVTAN